MYAVVNKKTLAMLIGGVAGGLLLAYKVRAGAQPTPAPSPAPTPQPSPAPSPAPAPSPPPTQPSVTGYIELWIYNNSIGAGRSVNYSVVIKYQERNPETGAVYTWTEKQVASGTLSPYGSGSYANVKIGVTNAMTTPVWVLIKSDDCINSPSMYGVSGSGASPSQVCKCGEIMILGYPNKTYNVYITPKEQAGELYTYVWNC